LRFSFSPFLFPVFLDLFRLFVIQINKFTARFHEYGRSAANRRHRFSDYGRATPGHAMLETLRDAQHALKAAYPQLGIFTPRAWPARLQPYR
jgi:hypothetical protein